MGLKQSLKPNEKLVSILLAIFLFALLLGAANAVDYGCNSNGSCNVYETCASCPSDCGCPERTKCIVGDNGWGSCYGCYVNDDCQSYGGEENCVNCPEDCSCTRHNKQGWICGEVEGSVFGDGCIRIGCNHDGRCEHEYGHENCSDCPDCACAPLYGEDWKCDTSNPNNDSWGGCAPPSSNYKEYCGNGYCDYDECSAGCVEDCMIGDCCGNEGCNREIGEDELTCPEDCQGKTCETFSDCFTGYTCRNGECVPLGAGQCDIAADCAETAPHIKHPVCDNGICVEGEQYKFSLESFVAGARDKFYSNGKGMAFLVFHAQELVETDDGMEWVDAPGLAVDFLLQKGAGGLYDMPLGSIEADEEATNEEGRIYATYTVPFISATSQDFYRTESIRITIMARAKKEGESLGGADYSIKLYPHIRIKAFKASPLNIDEQGKGLIAFRVEDPLGYLKTAEFYTKFAEASYDISGPFTTTETTESNGDDFDIYIKPIPGIRSINLNDFPETRDIVKNISKSVGKDMAISITVGGFQLAKEGKKAIMGLKNIGKVDKWVIDKGGSAVKAYIKAPGTYPAGVLTAQGLGDDQGAASGLGGSRSGAETAMYTCALAVDGASIYIAIVTAPLDFVPGVSQAKDLVVSLGTNTIKELAIAAAKTYRVGNAKERYYPRAIRAILTDVDGFEVTAWTHYYVRRYE